MSSQPESGVKLLPKVFIDESGTTGEDLLSLEQPVFTNGSTHLSDDEATDLLDAAGLQGRRDWKFRKLRKSNPGRKAILQVLEGLSRDTAKFVAAHKRYMVVAKVVDDLLEPVLKEKGIDLYDRGGQVVVANAWFQGIPHVLGKAAADSFFGAYIQMHRIRSSDTVAAFYEVVERLAKEASGVVAEDFLLLLENKKDAYKYYGDDRSPRDQLDPQTTLPVALLHDWGTELGIPFEVVYDRAATVEAWLPQLRPLLFSDMPRTQIGYGERSFTLPLLAANITFVDSEDVPQVQIADIVSGAAAYWLSGLAEQSPDNSFRKSLGETNMLQFLSLVIWPEKDAQLDDSDARQPFQADPGSETAAFISEWRNRRS